MTTKITGLTPSNVTALTETALPLLADLRQTTATFHAEPREAATQLEEIITRLPGRGHPRASLHAVVRKLRALP